MSTLVLVEFRAKPEAVSEVVELFRAVLGDTRAFDGCISVTVNQRDEDATQFVLVEEWSSRAHYERYFAWREEMGFVAKTAPILAEPPHIRYFDPVDV